ncbi:hypothetical protein U9M48_003478, partial [Paspalum notatum var. saurae]
EQDLSFLDEEFSEVDVEATIKDMLLDKAPGPDGFTGRFYLSCWQIIREDAMVVLAAIHKGHVAKFKLLNSAFFTLLPKKVDALEVKDFWPISLMHSFAKMVTKVLANRLAPRLPDLVSINQSAFIKGRSIQDNFLLFLGRFCSRCCSTWVLVIDGATCCVSSFPPPPRVCLLMENQGMWSCIGDISIYADDVILFLRPNQVDLSLISRLLEVFGHACGLRTNFGKSSIFPINCMEAELDIIKHAVACEVSCFPCKYHSIPLTVRKPSKVILLPLVDKVADCLPKWKASLLNRAGHLVVVKTVFTAIRIHLMTALDLPKCLIKAMDKLRRFLWFDQEKANGGNCLVSWENVQLGVSKKARRRCTVSQALTNRRWVTDIKGSLTIQVLVECVKVWELVDGVTLQLGVPDQFHWRFTQSEQYSCQFAYQALFLGTNKFGPWKRIWKSWAPLLCKFFIWLALKNRCWTADRLAKRRLPHPTVCPVCDQEQETMQHLLFSGVFSQEVWTLVFNGLGMSAVSPQLDVNQAPKEVKKGLNSLTILVAWELWKHRNDCVFEGALEAQEGNLWCLAGNSALSLLSA